MDLNLKDRRPIATRDKRWAKNSAVWLKNKGITPNQISVASMGFALVSGLCFLLAFYCETAFGRGFLLLLAALMIQGRLICNLLVAWWRWKAAWPARQGRFTTNYRIAFPIR